MRKLKHGDFKKLTQGCKKGYKSEDQTWAFSLYSLNCVCKTLTSYLQKGFEIPVGIISLWGKSLIIVLRRILYCILILALPCGNYSILKRSICEVAFLDIVWGWCQMKNTLILSLGRVCVFELCFKCYIRNATFVQSVPRQLPY